MRFADKSLFYAEKIFFAFLEFSMASRKDTKSIAQEDEAIKAVHTSASLQFTGLTLDDALTEPTPVASNKTTAPSKRAAGKDESTGETFHSTFHMTSPTIQRSVSHHEGVDYYTQIHRFNKVFIKENATLMTEAHQALATEHNILIDAYYTQ